MQGALVRSLRSTYTHWPPVRAWLRAAAARHGEERRAGSGCARPRPRASPRPSDATFLAMVQGGTWKDRASEAEVARYQKLVTSAKFAVWRERQEARLMRGPSRLDRRAPAL